MILFHVLTYWLCCVINNLLLLMPCKDKQQVATMAAAQATKHQLKIPHVGK